MSKIFHNQLLSILFMILVVGSGCMRYLTTDRSKVLLDGVDIDQTLKISRVEMDRMHGKIGSSLYLWSIRDQYITSEHARTVVELYEKYIDSLRTSFDVWHITWAVSNMYKSADDTVKTVLEKVYIDSKKRAEQLKGIANKMVNGEKIYRGDAHSGGRAFSRNHVVIPGNKKYQQSFEEYMKKKYGLPDILSK